VVVIVVMIVVVVVVVVFVVNIGSNKRKLCGGKLLRFFIR